MIIRTIKLKFNNKQEKCLEDWFFSLTSVYNWGLRKIELNAQDRICFSRLTFMNLLSQHSKKLKIPAHIIQGTLLQAYLAWDRCFKKLSKKPKLKGIRNKLNSISFSDPIKFPIDNKITLLGLGKVRFHKQELPKAKIKCGRIVKKASGWYLLLWLDTDNKFPVKTTNKAVGIDPGFSTLLTLSDGTKFENPRELRKGEKRLGQAQRGKRKQLVARLQEKQANRRNDRNHKISRKLVENYSTICYSKDNFSSLKHLFGKSVSEASLSQLIGMLTYKCRIGGRELIPVNSFHTTMTCGSCGALTGPKGLAGLEVRNWECCACGAHLDRDVNAARVVLNFGLGTSLFTGILKI